MIRCYIGLGSNQDNPDKQISSAIEAIRSDEKITLVDVSSRYRSAPYGPVRQPDFINAVAAVETEISAVTLLENLLKIENDMGRIRSTERWGPRIIDLDLLVYGEEIIDDKVLSVPHPEISRRNFVLYPLYELDNNMIIPGEGSLKSLIKKTSMDGLTKLP